jgi:hypothetical protein
VWGDEQDTTLTEEISALMSVGGETQFPGFRWKTLTSLAETRLAFEGFEHAIMLAIKMAPISASRNVRISPMSFAVAGTCPRYR